MVRGYVAAPPDAALKASTLLLPGGEESALLEFNSALGMWVSPPFETVAGEYRLALTHDLMSRPEPVPYTVRVFRRTLLPKCWAARSQATSCTPRDPAGTLVVDPIGDTVVESTAPLADSDRSSSRAPPRW